MPSHADLLLVAKCFVRMWKLTCLCRGRAYEIGGIRIGYSASRSTSTRSCDKASALAAACPRNRGASVSLLTSPGDAARMSGLGVNGVSRLWFAPPSTEICLQSGQI